MPDGDKVHERLAIRYQAPYKKLCEPHTPAETVASDACKRVLKDIKKRGNPPIAILRDIADGLKDIQHGPLFQDTNDWCSIREEVLHFIQQRNRDAQCDRRTIGIVQLSALRVLECLRQDANAENSVHALVREYFDGIYRAEFEEGIPFNEHHFNDVGEAFVQERLDAIRPDFNQYRDDIVAKICEKLDVKSVRMPNRHSKRIEPTIDDEIPLADPQDDTDDRI